jgi:BirA family transcriptional regulator, biotin operon repressor / biotin---[acetyl-CoA-carboxylase] ligase
VTRPVAMQSSATGVAFLSRRERFRSVPSTNDIVRTWLAEGTAEVCLAVTDEQTAGRGRFGRAWVAPSGAALLLSLGFRPSYLAPDRAWRLSAVVALAMIDAAEDLAGLPAGMLKLKWPNDIVVEAPAGEAPGGGLRKVAGLLGESEGVGTADPLAVIGIGMNVDWPRDQFPAELADSMTSLREASRGRPVSAEGLLEAFLSHLEPRVLGLRDGHFDVAGWHDRQITTGRVVRIDMPDGSSQVVRAVGVDGATGALLVADVEETADGAERELLVGEVVHVRLDADRQDPAAPTPAVEGVTN